MDRTNPELCSDCLGIFSSAGNYTLLDRDEPRDLLPKTCPVCAVIQFHSTIHQRNVVGVESSISTNASNDRTLKLKTFFETGYGGTLQLYMLPAKDTNEQLHWTKQLSVSTLSGDSIAFLKEQYDICLAEHDMCQRDHDTRPTRLLRIEAAQDSSGSQNIFIHLDDGQLPCPYITLSHCWGDLQPLQLTKQTEAELRAGMSTSKLPKTFREAVFVCQQLNVQHLWIDSLCIFQDSLQDWASEAAAMYTVYAHAVLNIAATGAANSTIGLSFERNPLAHQPFRAMTDEVEWVFPPDWTADIISESPLNQRAWVLQERFLSGRIVHFTIAGAYWDCPTSSSTEVFPVKPPYLSLYDFVGLMWLKTTIIPDNLRELFKSACVEAGDVDMKQVWRVLYGPYLHLVSMYTKCGMTKDADKLVAFNGIAQTLKGAIGAEMVCGLWQDLFIPELLWQVENEYARFDPPVLSQWRAPTWSWASADFHLSDRPYWNYHRSCDTVEEVVQVANIDEATLPSGQLEHATLTLRGTLVHARLSIDHAVWWKDLPATLSSEHDEIELNSNFFIFDRLPQFPYEEDLAFVALLRCNCAERGVGFADPDEPRPTVAALMLRRCADTSSAGTSSTGASSTYSRVGVFRIEGYEACAFYDTLASGEEEDIVLV